MNKISMQGSQLQSLTGPLYAKVALYEGVNLDSNMYSMVKEADDFVHLLGKVVQPTYQVYIDKNISGTEKLVADDEDSDVMSTPLDPTAVAGEDSETYELASSDLNKVLRTISRDNCTFEATDKGVNVTSGSSKFFISARRLNLRLAIPRYTLDANATGTNCYYPICQLNGPAFVKMLSSAIQLPRIASVGTTIKGRAIHLALTNAKSPYVQLESLSEMGCMKNIDSSCVKFFESSKVQGSKVQGSKVEFMHFAFSPAAAERLLDIMTLEGADAIFARDENDGTLLFWCGSEVIRIKAEDINECHFPDTSCIISGLSVDQETFLSVLQKVKKTGSHSVKLDIQSNGYMDIANADGTFTTSFVGTSAVDIKDVLHITLPLTTFIAIVKGYRKETINLWIDDSTTYIATTNNIDTTWGAVKKI